MSDILQYKNYFGSVQFSAADEVFHGKILSISDMVNFEGESVKELKAAFEEAVEDYLETCAEIGKTPEKAYKGTFNVRVPSSLHKNAAIFAAAHNITLNEFVKKALAFSLDRKDEMHIALDNE
ncbi:type II toxin-antitoxin system HicB family antitoxin [Mucilaginibacter psychrotolerans]|uniref:Type II toxin-antitoxin system HicB family antitoxin n=1 Tax=Mucilaginibacter psychrotolerans TaxID=1524096 RepID=A0A4Y8SJQ5_9SPHI|nr:type II toxin-antitoxin system HicB family antitoxin [Mucilaginibacter psychrotolerans]TFF38880.1 type II toxin-antitoxin system HicB family antitoxin [Mucilaginibacter psychrotolerans]